MYNKIWFFKSIMEQLEEAIIVADLDEKIVYINKSCEKMYGISSSSLIGKFLSDMLIVIDKDKEDLRKISQTIKDEKIYYGSHFSKRNNGEEFIVSIKIASLKDEEENKIGYVGTIQDVTLNMEFERTLKETTIELQEKNKELEQFAYITSHDLQEPLRIISNYSQLLHEKYQNTIDEETEKYFNYILDSANRMRILIKELLDFSRVGRKDAPFEKINIDKMLEDIEKDFILKIKETDAKIRIETSLPEIYGIRIRIKQLFHNLISNSLKYRGKDNPQIVIGCYDDDPFYTFYVKDNGIGIEEKYFDRIFGIFKRLYSREQYPGTGIGLALCQRIVETHGGKIWVDSEPGSGSIFYFTISKSINFT